MTRLTLPLLGAAVFAASMTAGAQQQGATTTLQLPPSHERTFSTPDAYVPDLARLDATTSELRDVVERFGTDREALLRFYSIPGSRERRGKLSGLYAAWLESLPRIDFNALSREGQVDYVTLRNHIQYQTMLLGREERRAKEIEPLVPFADAIIRLQEDRQKLRFIPGGEAAAEIARLGNEVKAQRESVEAGLTNGGSAATKIPPITAVRAAEQIDRLRAALGQWFGFYNGYDPAFTTQVPEGYRAANQALVDYAKLLREKVAGLKPVPETAADGRGSGRGRGDRGRAPAPPATDEIVGDPIGRDGLLEDLAGEMIPYTPEQLIEIGNREYAWCEEEMKKAAREMGFGDDWMAALEKVKNQYVPRGGQPELIRDLALEAVAYLQKHDLVTIPPLATDIWRMGMMSAERQRVNPFFTGGETISVSYPTDAMSAEDSMMSMRGNGVHVSRATVHHELIPGHHLKGFMNDRYNTHRKLFETPFVTEGWALYWELLLWDHGFLRSPEDRVGMLWWRMHRAARIIFSLNFHLGRWTPEQCIDFLVERVGHERFTATGEVRRSFAGNYSPLYQVAYMMGGLQIRSLYNELVGTGKMTAKAFHDAILRANYMPIEMLRALMTDQPLTRDYRSQWKYYGDVAPSQQ